MAHDISTASSRTKRSVAPLIASDIGVLTYDIGVLTYMEERSTLNQIMTFQRRLIELSKMSPAPVTHQKPKVITCLKLLGPCPF